MVIISEVASVTDLVLKANKLLRGLPENWYKGNSKIKTFKSDLLILSQQTAQWEMHLEQRGMSELQDPVLMAFLAKASKLLDTEEEYYEENQKSQSWKWRRRSFPEELTYILSNVLRVVEAGPQRLAESFKMHHLLTKRFQMEPSQLPFRYDPKYVPLQRAIDMVQWALTVEDGPQVVTLHGEPGTGKSSLAKYLALLIQDSMRGSTSTSCSFDGVQYLFCGQGCGKNIHQLQRNLFSNLGLRAVLGASVEGQEGHYNLSSYQSKLRRVLGNRRMLIILDDVWREDFEVLISLVSRGARSKYLLTSQTRNVWPDAWCIQMPRPTDQEALDIFAKYLQGYSTNSYLQASSSSHHMQASSSCNYVPAPSCGSHSDRSSGSSHLQEHLSRSQMPFSAANLEKNVGEMIWKLGNHPLSLVNAAISMGRSGALDSHQWKLLAQNMFAFLEEDYGSRPIPVFERPYSLSMSDSMTLMVESLREKERHVLFLISLLARRKVTEHLVRFFMRRFHDSHSSQSTFEYNFVLNYLEDNSLVQVHRSEPWSTFLVDSEEINSISLTVHSLRREFIRRKYLPELQNVISNLVTKCGDDNHNTSLGNVRDDDQSLAVVLGAAYLDPVVVDELTLSINNGMARMSLNGDGAPRRLGQHLAPSMSKAIGPRGPDQVSMSRSVATRGPQLLVETRELLKSMGNMLKFDPISEAIEITMGLLNLEGEELWKQHVHSDASKIITRFVCKSQLDDASMASLLIIPYTTSAASEIFQCMYMGGGREDLRHGFYYGQSKSFSDTFPATWHALSNLLYSKKLPLASLPSIIQYMLEFEAESKVLVELEKLCELADRSCDLHFQNAVHVGFLYLHSSRLTFEMLNALNLQKYLSTILWKLILDDEDYVGDWVMQSGGRGERWDMQDSVDRTYYEVLRCIAWDKGYAKTVLTCPISCEEWLTDASLFRRLVELEGWEPLHTFNTGIERLLGVLSETPEFQTEALGILKGERWKELQVDFTLWPESYNFRLARFWGNVGLLGNVDVTTSLRLVKIVTDWGAKVSAYYPDGVICSDCVYSISEEVAQEDAQDTISVETVGEVMRTVTIISHLHANSPVFSSPLLLAEWIQTESTYAGCKTCMAESCNFYIAACRGQAEAYHEMEMYDKALLFLNSMERASNAFQDAVQMRARTNDDSFFDILHCPSASLRLQMMLVRALSKDYQGAMDSLCQYERSLSDDRMYEHSAGYLSILGNRAVLLRLSGDISKSIQNFDQALEFWETMTSQRCYWDFDPRIHNWLKCCLLEHRGFAKYLMGDLEGSKLDRDSAADCRSSKAVVEPISWKFLTGLHSREILLDYSLLQLPISYG